MLLNMTKHSDKKVISFLVGNIKLFFIVKSVKLSHLDIVYLIIIKIDYVSKEIKKDIKEPVAAFEF